MKREYFEAKKGEAVYVYCARRGYRGIVEEVGEDGVLLSNPYVIFDADSYLSEKMREEFLVPSDLLIALDAIEAVSQPIGQAKRAG